jgi:hypothetical protein
MNRLRVLGSLGQDSYPQKLLSSLEQSFAFEFVNSFETEESFNSIKERCKRSTHNNEI